MKLYKSGFVAATLVFSITTGYVYAATSTNFSIPWDAVSSGGTEVATSSNYQLRDTAGQQGPRDAAGATFQTRGGYRSGDILPPPPAPVSTGGGPGVSAPIISSVTASSITKNSARITWTTDKDSNSSVSYGVTVAYASGTTSDAALVTSHSIILTGLNSNTTYHYSVASVDVTALSRSSGDYIFTTLPDTTPPVISSIRVVGITETVATVMWDTDEPASSLVTYGSSTSYGSAATTGGLITTHSVGLPSLRGGTVYHFFPTSADVYGNVATSTRATFTTLADVTSPSNVAGFLASPGDKKVTLVWINPTEADFFGTRIVRKLGGFPSGPSDGTIIFNGLASSTTDGGLTNGVEYFYGAYAYDVKNNFASGALRSATPVAPTPPPTKAPTSTTPLPPSTTSTIVSPSPTSTLPVKPLPIFAPTPTPTSTVPVSSTSTPFIPISVPTLVVPLVTLPRVTSTVLFPPTILVATGTLETGGIEKMAVSYFGLGGDIALEPDASQQLGVLTGSPVLVRISMREVSKPFVAGFLKVGDFIYALQLAGDKTALTTSFAVPVIGSIPSTVSLTFEDGTQIQHTALLRVQPLGRVVEDVLTGISTQAISGAKIQLWRDVRGAWEPYGFSLTSDVSGAYAYVVPNGRYYTEVEKAGYRKLVSNPVSIDQNVYNQTLHLIPLPVTRSLEPEAPLVQNIILVGKNAADQAVYAAHVTKQVIQSPKVQAANAVAAPAVLTVSLVNTASTISLFNIFSYLQYIFTQPLLLLGRRKRKQWGSVFNSLTKQPIHLAIVRLLQAETGLVVQTRVTDVFGRYAFIAKTGRYILEVVKPGYAFPSQYLADKNTDVEFIDLYHGDLIAVDVSFVITPNIPLDPVVSLETPKAILWKRTRQRLRHATAFSGILLGMFAVMVTPSAPTALMLLAQVGVYLLFRRLALPTQAKSWGVAFDTKTRQPLPGAIVRIFDKKFNKLLETQVTDKNGKYGFLVRRNIYYVTAEKEGYKLYTSPDIDLAATDEAFVDQNLSMERMM